MKGRMKRDREWEGQVDDGMRWDAVSCWYRGFRCPVILSCILAFRLYRPLLADIRASTASHFPLTSHIWFILVTDSIARIRRSYQHIPFLPWLKSNRILIRMSVVV